MALVWIVAASASHNLVKRVAAEERRKLDPVVRLEDSGGAAHGKGGSALVERGAQLLFLGCHKAARPEHLAYVVSRGDAVVVLKVDNVDLAAVEVVDEAAVVEVDGDPTVGGIAKQLDVGPGMPQPRSRE